MTRPRTTVSLITVVRNGEATIGQCMDSIRQQTVLPFEYIVVDGNSTDGTLSVINKHWWDGVKVISEPDDGIYDAMNKGIRNATGDVVGILNSDDFYIDSEVIAKVASAFDELETDSLFADLVYVRPDNLNHVVRYYSGAGFAPHKFARGQMPPHPTFFVRRECYLKYGLFKTDYTIAADFELLVRFFCMHRISYHHLPEVIVKMRTGGVSTRNFKSNIILNREVLRACAENGIPTNVLNVYSKYFYKCRELFVRPA